MTFQFGYVAVGLEMLTIVGVDPGVEGIAKHLLLHNPFFLHDIQIIILFKMGCNGIKVRIRQQTARRPDLR